MAITPEKLRKIAISYKLLSVADDSLGIYCEKVYGEGGYEKRTEWMEGWNAHAIQVTDNWCLLSDWLKSLSDEVRSTVEDLILEDNLNIGINDKEVKLWVNCSDLFWWACADEEDITLEEIPSLVECLELSPAYGGELWCARKRGMRPQKPYYKYFNEEECKLFDACGPERTE